MRLIQDNVPLSSEQFEKAAQQAIQDLAVKEGEALTDNEKRAFAKKLLIPIWCWL
ncbi:MULTISPECIES: hypothetical protein [Francisella]|uniref:hypothetical protein n=1 Tax=Francisella TaxID=262 RepID=UPI00090A2B5F|nr:MULTISPECIES: hypothetical protein [Francisella]APC91478.1 hypothetical protein BBG19_0742 [Francisella sp. MA067296]